MIPNVYLHDHICDSAVARLRRHVNLVDNFDHPEELDAIIVRQQYCPREVISRAKRCRLIQMHGVGLDRIDVEAAKEYGISVKRTKGGNAQSVAELAIGFMLAMARKMKFLDRGLQAGKFQTFGLPETVGLELSGKKLGLVGGGQIAQLVADIAHDGRRRLAALIEESHDDARAAERPARRLRAAHAHAETRAERPEFLLGFAQFFCKSQQHRLRTVAVLMLIRHSLLGPFIHFHDMLTCFFAFVFIIRHFPQLASSFRIHDRRAAHRHFPQ